MEFVISATDTSGRVMLKRASAGAAVKKASELVDDGCWDVSITGPDGVVYASGDFGRLQP